MFEKRQIEELLRINGVPLHAPEEEIKSVLLSARWHERDVETALLVLRENTMSHETHVDSLHKVFASDEKLKPETISALLGVDIDVTGVGVSKDWKKPRRTVTFWQACNIAFVASVLAVSCTIGAMWYLEVGMFHFTMR